MLWTGHRQAVDAVRAHLHLTHVSVAEVNASTDACVVGGWRRDGTRLVGPGQVAVGGVRVVNVVERRTAVADVYIGPVRYVRLDENGEAVDAVDCLLQLVRPLVLLRVLQTLGAERAQQQRQEQIQNLRITIMSMQVFVVRLSHVSCGSKTRTLRKNK